MDTNFWLKSSEIKIELGEDEETNPMRYGKNLSKWISDSFQVLGYKTKYSPEGWGWRVDCLSEPCPVWIGVGNVDQFDDDGNFIKPEGGNVVWHCFIEADVPFFANLFKKIDPSVQVEKVGRDLANLFSNTPHIQLVEEP